MTSEKTKVLPVLNRLELLILANDNQEDVNTIVLKKLNEINEVLNVIQSTLHLMANKLNNKNIIIGMLENKIRILNEKIRQ